MSGAIEDMVAYTQLTDSIIQQIMMSSDPHLQKVRHSYQYYIILYYIILYYIILYYIILYYIILHYITLYYIILYYIILGSAIVKTN